MTEREICDWLYARFKDGKRRFGTGEPCPHSPNSVAGLMDLLGWCEQDKRRALMKADPRYGEEQHRLEAEGVFK